MNGMHTGRTLTQAAYDLRILDHEAVIRPCPPPEALDDQLNVPVGGFVPDARRGYPRVTTGLLKLVGRQKDVCVLPATLWKLARDLLKAAGHRVHVRVERTRSRLKFDRSRLEDKCDEYAAIAAAVRKKRWGQIEIDDEDDALQMIGLVAALWPRARILICVATYKSAAEWTDRLTTRLELRVTCVARNMRRKAERIAVQVFGPVSPWESGVLDILLFPEPRQAIGRRAWEATQPLRAEAERIYSFVPVGLKLSRNQQILLNSVSGPRIIQQISDRADVRLVRLRSPRWSVDEGLSAREWKRNAYFVNEKRNDFVAAVVRAVANGKASRLKKHGVPQSLIEEACGRRPAKTVVLVESTEHGREINERLPDSVLRSLCEDRSEQEQEAQQVEIMTVSYANRNGVRADVLIVASGDVGSLTMQGFPPRRDYRVQSVLVIDFDDASDVMARAESERRHKECLERGWRPVPLGDK